MLTTEAGKRMLAIAPPPDEHGNAIAWAQRIADVEAEARLDTLRLLRYLWEEADIGDNRRVSDLFKLEDPLAQDIEKAISAIPDEPGP